MTTAYAVADYKGAIRITPYDEGADIFITAPALMEDVTRLEGHRQTETDDLVGGRDVHWSDWDSKQDRIDALTTELEAYAERHGYKIEDMDISDLTDNL